MYWRAYIEQADQHKKKLISKLYNETLCSERTASKTNTSMRIHICIDIYVYIIHIIYIAYVRGVSRTLSNIWDEAFCENSQQLLAVSYYRTTLHLRYLTGFWIRPCYDWTFSFESLIPRKGCSWFIFLFFPLFLPIMWSSQDPIKFRFFLSTETVLKWNWDETKPKETWCFISIIM